MSHELWMASKNFKSAYGENPETIDTRGHIWTQVHLEGHSWSSVLTSWQQCKLCQAIRGVLMHPTPYDKPDGNGIYGPNIYPNEREKTKELANNQCVVTDKETIKLLCKSKTQPINS